MDNLQDLLNYAVNNNACEEGIIWLKKRLNQPIEKVFKEMPGHYQAWILSQGQPQFSTHCDLNKLNGEGWSWLLRHQPQLSNHCDWSKLDGTEWAYLLIDQPQFAEYCDWNKLYSWHWSYLLSKQPQFEKFKK